jgi:hypothetical protein
MDSFQVATSGGQKGNKNAAKGGQWRAAVEYALENYEDSQVERGLALRAIAKKMVEQAIAGDKDARNEIACRLDGKPVQPIEGEINLNANVEQLTDAVLERIASGRSQGTPQAKTSQTKVH